MSSGTTRTHNSSAKNYNIHICIVYELYMLHSGGEIRSEGISALFIMELLTVVEIESHKENPKNRVKHKQQN